MVIDAHDVQHHYTLGDAAAAIISRNHLGTLCQRAGICHRGSSCFACDCDMCTIFPVKVFSVDLVDLDYRTCRPSAAMSSSPG